MKNKVNKMKLFKEKAGMTGTTKFNFMKHLPNHQPNRSRFAMVFLLFMTFLLGSVQGWGQSASATWALTSDGNASVSGNVTANSIAIGSGINTPVYNSTIGISTGSWTNDAPNRVK